MPIRSPRHNAGFTLVEIVLVIVLLAVLATMTVTNFSDSTDAVKYEVTRRKMETIRQAILGQADTSSEGERKNFGYHGDMGRLPSSLSFLISTESPAWSFSTQYGVGAGWHGSYLTIDSSDKFGITRDAWGKTFDYSTATNPPRLISYGVDNASGGTGFSSDLTIQFSNTVRLSTVTGYVLSGTSPQQYNTVEIRYPVAGTLTAFTTVTDANGYWSFSGVPHGVRSLRIVGPTALGPKQIIVDRDRVNVSNAILNFFSKLEAFTFVSGSYNTQGSGDGTLTWMAKSSYSSPNQIASVYATWDRNGSTKEGYINYFAVNGAPVTFTTALGPGAKFNVEPNWMIPANSSQNSIEIRFSSATDGSGTRDMDNSNFGFKFYWVGKSTMVYDSIGFAVP